MEDVAHEQVPPGESCARCRRVLLPEDAVLLSATAGAKDWVHADCLEAAVEEAR